jgi:hypothetical protein
MRCNYFESESDVVRTINEVESGAISDRWDHHARLVVTMWYLLMYDEAAATARLVSRTRAIARQQQGRYNETATVFWIAIARVFLLSSGSCTDRLHTLNRFLGCYCERETLIYEYYRPHTLQSWEARVRWVDPDLKPLPETAESTGARPGSR